ncbi:hypothetical protein HPP92_011656 [Vanilla planifolia]|uniref:ABC transmembrane type-1 domain-containing protein n=1 Tax=Vanilla planifolia TaxID=51239 RepID=A0A835R6G4_VANPL|nr:hypothetical protein HPP92_011656 [Vanilla planifolia]
MEMAWFDEPENSSGAVGARLSTDAAIVRNLLGDALGLAVHNITILVAGLAIAFASNLKLSLIILVMLPFMCLNGWIQMKSMRGFSRDAKKMYEQASQVANDAVSSIRTVASLSAEEKVVELYQKKCEGPTRKGIRQGVISGIGFGVSSSLIYCAYAASFYAGARLVRSGETTFGKVFQVFFAFTMAATGISESNSAVPNAEKAKSATASVFAVLDRKSKIDPSDVSGMTLENLEGEIKFRHVSFKYPSRPEVQIFHDLCLSIKSGTTVALVGESGSGKSTAIALLQRFYDPDSGNILLDGIELHKFNLKWLRQQMSWVSQEPALFNDTIRANIAFGIEGNATETEIVAAAKAANAHEFICYLQKNDNITDHMSSTKGHTKLLLKESGEQPSLFLPSSTRPLEPVESVVAGAISFQTETLSDYARFPLFNEVGLAQCTWAKTAGLVTTILCGLSWVSARCMGRAVGACVKRVDIGAWVDAGCCGST